MRRAGRLAPNKGCEGVLALVLANSRGRALEGLTAWQTKAAVPFGGQYRIVDFVLSNCVNSEIRSIALLTQYKSQSLIRHVHAGRSEEHTSELQSLAYLVCRLLLEKKKKKKKIHTQIDYNYIT